MIKSYLRSLYKRLLAEGSLFFDDRARTFIINRTKKAFREYETCQDQQRIKHKIKEARRHLHCIEAANRGVQKKALKILYDAYGRTGKTRHLLLAPYLNALIPSTPFVLHAPRTAPPPELSPILACLIKNDLSKALEPELPVPLYKPLHPGRKANLLWKYRSSLIERIQPPLPLESVQEIEKKISHITTTNGAPKWNTLYFDSHIDLSHLSPTAKIIPRSRFQRRLQLESSPFQFTKSIESFLPKEKEILPKAGDYSERQKRRLYQRLLQKVPLITNFDGSNMYEGKLSLFRSKMAIGNKFETVDIPEDVVKREIKSINNSKKKERKKERKGTK